MTITRKRVRDGIIVHDVLITDLQGDAATVAGEIEHVDPGASGVLAGYADAADRTMAECEKWSPRWRAARAMRIHAREAARYLREGDAELSTWNALQAAHHAWVADVKMVEPAIVTGTKSRRGADKGRAVRKAALNPEHARWRATATAMRAANPKLSNSDIAVAIDPDRWHTIRRVIAK